MSSGASLHAASNGPQRPICGPHHRTAGYALGGAVGYFVAVRADPPTAPSGHGQATTTGRLTRGPHDEGWMGRAEWLSRLARIRSPAWQCLLALAAYLAAWLSTEARPLIEHPARAQLDQVSMDPNLFVWCLRWWPYAISHGLNPLYSGEIGEPAGHVLAWVTTVAPLGLLAAPITATAGPVVAFNLLAALALPVSAWAAFLLCRRLTGHFWPALVGGFIFGFSGYEMNHIDAGQLDIVFSLLLPLMAYLILLWRDGAIRSRTLVALLGVSMAAQFYLFLETFADLTGVLVIGLAVGYVVADRSSRPVVVRLSRLVAMAYGLALVLAAPSLWVALTHMPPKFNGATSLDLASLVLPSPNRTFGVGWLAHAAALPTPESADGYVGVPLLLIAVALAVSAWSSRLTRFLAVMLAIIVAAALGPVVHLGGKRLFSLPWSGVWHLPLLRSAFPARLMVFAFLILAVMAAQWLAAPMKGRLARWSLAALAVAAIVLDTPSLEISPHSSVPRFISAGWYRHHVKSGETVLVISKRGNAGLLWQAESDFYMKLAGGYISQMLTPRTDLPHAVQNLAHATPLYAEQFRAFVKRAKVGVILVDASAAPKWAGIFARLGLHGRQTGGVIVYQTNGCRACRVPHAAQH